MPELNFKLNIARSLSSVWQEYQGLGLLGGMAHAADLPRQVILWIFSFILPQAGLRYFWAFLMLSVGPLGVYLLVRQLLKNRGDFEAYVAPFASGVFYIFNLATVQTFFTPFETFVSFYGFFPWLLFEAVKYLESGEKKSLLTFAVISLLGMGAFYVQTLFVVYAIFLVVLGLEAIIRKKGQGIVRCLKLALVTIFINSFWLAPAVYFTATNAEVVGASHINSIATPETQIMNQARSGVEDIATLQGYWFDYYDWSADGKYSLLYQDWIDFRQIPNIGKLSLALFGVSVAGFIFALFKSKKIFGTSFIILLGISFYMLSGENISFVPYLEEAFRNVFTKWSTAASLIYAVGLGFFVYTLSDFIKSKLKYIPSVIFSGAIIGGSVFTVLPILQGKLIADSMKVELPSYYLDTVSYFEKVDSTKRIATFPLTDFWGWQFNDWGYRGSGFIWYGIPQPILSRTFDVWSTFNEEFYEEANYAISWGSIEDLEIILEKYQVSYLVFDGSVYQPGNPNSDENFQKQKEFLESSSLVSKEATFGELIIYSVDSYKVNLSEINKFVSAPQVDYGKPLYGFGDVQNLVISESFPEDQGYLAAKNCNLLDKGKVVREKRGGSNYYKAEEDGVSCDYFYYPTLDLSKAYKMRVMGENISGRSLRFYLYNVKGEKVYMDELLPTGAFDESYVILPTGTEEDIGGYTLNVETRSFGKVKSENLVTGIEFYELEAVRTEPIPIQNNLQILDVQKYGTWGYRVEIGDSRIESSKGLLMLGQGYDKGWKAFYLPSNVFHLSFLEHIKVNSWANGWIVPNQPINQSTIYLIFWPHLLEWGGILAGVITLLVLILSKFRNR